MLGLLFWFSRSLVLVGCCSGQSLLSGPDSTCYWSSLNLTNRYSGPSMTDEYGVQPMDYDDFFEDIDGSNPEPNKFCGDCDKAFFTNGLLEVHRQKVHEDAPLLGCFTCNLDFKRKMGWYSNYLLLRNGSFGSLITKMSVSQEPAISKPTSLEGKEF